MHHFIVVILGIECDSRIGTLKLRITSKKLKFMIAKAWRFRLIPSFVRPSLSDFS